MSHQWPRDPVNAWAKLFPTAMGGDMEYSEANNPFTLAVKNAAALRVRIATHLTPGNWQSGRCEELHQVLVEHMIQHEYCFLANVKTHNRVLVMDTLGDAEFSFFSSSLMRGKRWDTATPLRCAWCFLWYFPPRGR